MTRDRNREARDALLAWQWSAPSSPERARRFDDLLHALSLADAATREGLELAIAKSTPRAPWA